MGIWIAILVLILIGAFLIGVYNRFVQMNNKVAEATATIDVYLKKRYDLIPNIVETVKGYSKHESETLEKVVEARNKAVSSNTVVEKNAAEAEMVGALRQLFALSEAYPDLKANTNFMSLQDQLSNIESELVSARKYYNGVVKTYNTLLQTFPNNVLAGLFGFQTKDLYVIENVEERKNVNVKF